MIAHRPLRHARTACIAFAAVAAVALATPTQADVVTADGYGVTLDASIDGCRSYAEREHARGHQAGERDGRRNGYRDGMSCRRFCDTPRRNLGCSSRYFRDGYRHAYSEAYACGYEEGRYGR